MEHIIEQGAEAILVKKGSELIKRRIPKGYRHPELDKKLRIRRTRSEAKLLEKAYSAVNAPKVRKTSDYEIDMDFIDGKRLSDELDNLDKEKALLVCSQIGQEIAKLHNNGIIHGDLTTSNMILYNNKVYLIDFGLGFVSGKIEDKAVDLHLLKQAFESKHFERWEEYYKSAIKSYKENSKEAKLVLERLEKVEKRGRYKRKNKRD